MQGTKGFTLAEIIIALGIVAILALAVSVSVSSFGVSAKMRSAVEVLLSAVRFSQENSKAGIADSPHGVYVRTDGDSLIAVSYEGPSYPLRNIGNDREFEIGTEFFVSGTDLVPDIDGGFDINFSQGEGIPDKTGYITLGDSRSGSQRTISITGLLASEISERRP